MPLRLLCLLLLTLGPVEARAEDVAAHVAKVRLVLERLRTLAHNPEVLAAVRAQNARRIPLADIQQLDARWMGSSGTQDFMRPYLDNACAAVLRGIQKDAAFMGDAFVMDDQGALVAATQRTTDFWQGDEEKWKRSFADGKGAEFVDTPDFDESVQAYVVQVSLPVMDGGRAIGALTVSLNLDAL
ncbi:PDC sensor domain-containing protein [Vitiosangium sp. GDMCC 1.1324]|uniref:PDC sensor domain-containing protein n=1 Tax=Vitiosangium sp. (strain GDMCC 1.1324) TaxID=2138576 RepID=UPI000D362354|nr:PDC sensor domain-containing protein [Vitiosangium sp. GDMCC 1.1324]PTL84432.1 hypothetical protein DAT35_04890 [Vitiosangium sp. GDMCC 1.1324]